MGKPLKSLTKKDRKFINYRTSHNNPRPKAEETTKYKEKMKNEFVR